MDGLAFPTDRHIPPSSGGPTTTTAKTAAKTAAGAPERPFHLFGNDGFSFRDLLDIINPLQHIPLVSTIYRKVTGDALDALPRVAGGTLFGGIAGAVSAVVNVVVKAASGKDIGETALAFIESGFSGNDPVDAPHDPAAMVARAPEAAFNASWQAAVAMQYCDAECLDPKRSFFTDAVEMAAMSTASLLSEPALSEPALPEPAVSEGDQAAAAARYAEATELAALGGRRLDMRG
ncbi:MAG: hypothetical protein ACXW3P_03645 [Rhodospirillales bacterium]